jgi:hypothetical protein
LANLDLQPQLLLVFSLDRLSRIFSAANPAAGQSPGVIRAENVLNQQHLSGLIEQGSNHSHVLPRHK